MTLGATIVDRLKRFTERLGGKPMTIAAHLPDYLAAIDRRAAEEPDGDYDPIQPEYFERAKAFLAKLAEHAPDLPRVTGIMPSAAGEIIAEWRGGGRVVSVEVGEQVELWVYENCRVSHRQTINPDCPICREQVVAAVEGSQ